MQRNVLRILTVVTGIFGGLTVLALLINIILNYTQPGHVIPPLDLWAGAGAAVLAVATLACVTLWHKTDEKYGKRALIVSELVLLPLFLMVLYGMLLFVLLAIGRGK